jgi:D-beta-D-heptose 7-phosphate kinase / D-beta-D-heptose 1-phosphate adenosyltransferase
MTRLREAAERRMYDIETAIERISEQTVLCIGDLMLDEFVYGEVSRVSPEAPVPVIAAKREEKIIGAAGNVARNIASLGARCLFVSVIGADDAGIAMRSAFAAFRKTIEPHLVVDRSRPTTRKVRFVSEHYSSHLLRADWETARPVAAEIEAELIDLVAAMLPRVGAVVISDYAKGVLTPRVVRAVIDGARELGKPVVVDPKGIDYTVYSGATVITPNRKELADATRRPVATHQEVAVAAAELGNMVGSRAVLVTLSEDGMLLLPEGGTPVHVPAYAVRIRDVTGAGDTVVSVLAALLAVGTDFETGMRAANAAASVVVGKPGTATVSALELRSRILPSAALAAEEKIAFDWAVADERVRGWRAQGLRVGFTNGCFDLLHPGHVKVLAAARAECDRLVVGLNGDASVRRLKGPTRPIQDAHARADVLAALEAVDLVVVFDEDTPLELITRLKPTMLAKGGDWRKEEVVGRDVVEAQGGHVVLVDLVPGHSTTRIVEKSASPPAAKPTKTGSKVKA